VWKVRPTEQGGCLGHEYWLAHGETIGCYGHVGGQPVSWFVCYDNSEHIEAVMQADPAQFHCNDRSLIVGYGAGSHPCFCCGGGKVNPWESHAPCANTGQVSYSADACASAFQPGGRQNLFTGDRSDSGYVHLVDVSQYEELSPLET
jgi:hypothetical protein